MIGWIVALLVLVIAGVLVWRLQLRLAARDAEAESLRESWHHSQEQLESARSDAALGRLLADLGDDLAHEPAPPAQPPERLIQMLVDYRKLVHDYDAAVQYCLQPVELMPGADEDDLEQLMGHVSGARKRLFEARTSLVDNDMLKRMPELIEKATARAPDDGLAQALGVVAAAGRGAHALELGEVLKAALRLARARHAGGPALQGEVGELPVLPPWPWLVPMLVQALQLGMLGSAKDAPAQFVAHFTDGQVHVEFAGARLHVAGSPEQQAMQADFTRLQQRFDERGLSLTLHLEDPRRQGFDLAIEVPTGNAPPQ